MSERPIDVFDRQIDCLRRGDRDGQMALYADDLIYEFPFAIDRPRRIVGVQRFREVMEPLWRRAATVGLKVVGYSGEAHTSADDPELVFAEFVLVVESPTTKTEIQFVQVLKIRGGRIVAGREYFSPDVRSRFDDAP